MPIIDVPRDRQSIGADTLEDLYAVRVQRFRQWDVLSDCLALDG